MTTEQTKSADEDREMWFKVLENTCYWILSEGYFIKL